MKIEEVIKQLERLIDDREAFIRAYAPDRNVFVRDKEALEEAMKVLKQYNRLVQVKARPVKQHIKIQYEGEELTIKELVDRLRYALVDRDDWKELAEARYDWILELKKQLSDAQTVRHGRWITVVETDGKEHSKCADCQMELDGLEDAYSFCPYCGAKMDGKDTNVPTNF